MKSSEVCHSDELLKVVGALFNNPELSDFCLCVGGQQYHLHRAIIFPQSPVFQKLFESADDVTGGDPYNRVNQVSHTAECVTQIEEFFRYFYTGKLNLTVDNAVPMVLLAYHYKVTKLAVACRSFLREYLHSKNADIEVAFRWYTDPHLRANEHLRWVTDESFKCVQKRLGDVINCNSVWLNLEFDKVWGILKSSDVSVKDEYTLYRALVKWLLNAFGDNEDELERKLKDFLEYVRFPMMSSTDLDELQEKCPLYRRYAALYDGLLVEAYRYNSNRDISAFWGHPRFELRKYSRRPAKLPIAEKHRSRRSILQGQYASTRNGVGPRPEPKGDERQQDGERHRSENGISNGIAQDKPSDDELRSCQVQVDGTTSVDDGEETGAATEGDAQKQPTPKHSELAHHSTRTSADESSHADTLITPIQERNAGSSPPLTGPVEPELSLADGQRREGAISEDNGSVVSDAESEGSTHEFSSGTAPVVFRCDRPGQNVCVAGSFSNWERVPMHYDEKSKCYILRFDLAAGEYQYKYCIDNEWHLHPDQETITTEDSFQNHIIRVEARQGESETSDSDFDDEYSTQEHGNAYATVDATVFSNASEIEEKASGNTCESEEGTVPGNTPQIEETVSPHVPQTSDDRSTPSTTT